jgi:hypothetical protein
MALPRAINDAHSPAPDFFKNLIIAYTPIGVTYIECPEPIIKRFFLRCSCGGSVTGAPISADPRRKKAAQTKTASDARSRTALGAGTRLFLEVHRVRTGGLAHEEVRMVDEVYQVAN